MGCLKLDYTESEPTLYVSASNFGGSSESVLEYNHFELRMYDPLIGRWLQVDPYRVGNSPYIGMSNRPNGVTDPDGGCPDDDPDCWETAYNDPNIDASSLIPGEVVVTGIDQSGSIWNSTRNSFGRMFDAFFQGAGWNFPTLEHGKGGIELMNSGLSGSGFTDRQGNPSHAIIDPVKNLIVPGAKTNGNPVDNTVRNAIKLVKYIDELNSLAGNSEVALQPSTKELILIDTAWEVEGMNHYGIFSKDGAVRNHFSDGDIDTASWVRQYKDNTILPLVNR